MKNSTKLNAGTLLFLFAIFLCSCGPKANEEIGAKEVRVEKEKATKRLKINIDMEKEKKLQKAADLGFKPWKMKAIDVAEECIIGKGIGASTGECEILSENETNAVVRVKTRKEGSFKVHLKRLVKPGGIWTATEVEKED